MISLFFFFFKSSPKLAGQLQIAKMSSCLHVFWFELNKKNRLYGVWRIWYIYIYVCQTGVGSEICLPRVRLRNLPLLVCHDNALLVCIKLLALCQSVRPPIQSHVFLSHQYWNTVLVGPCSWCNTLEPTVPRCRRRRPRPPPFLITTAGLTSSAVTCARVLNGSRLRLTAAAGCLLTATHCVKMLGLPVCPVTEVYFYPDDIWKVVTTAAAPFNMCKALAAWAALAVFWNARICVLIFYITS